MIAHFPREIWVWILALGALAWIDPSAPALVELCLLKAAGITWCPGCGLGHAIAFLLEGQWSRSWDAHPLGGPALLVIMHHVTQQLMRTYRQVRATSS